MSVLKWEGYTTAQKYFNLVRVQLRYSEHTTAISANRFDAEMWRDNPLKKIEIAGL